jgi:hypothetical protein
LNVKNPNHKYQKTNNNQIQNSKMAEIPEYQCRAKGSFAQNIQESEVFQMCFREEMIIEYLLVINELSELIGGLVPQRYKDTESLV